MRPNIFGMRFRQRNIKNSTLLFGDVMYVHVAGLQLATIDQSCCCMCCLLFTNSLLFCICWTAWLHGYLAITGSSPSSRRPRQGPKDGGLWHAGVAAVRRPCPRDAGGARVHGRRVPQCGTAGASCEASPS